MLKLKITTVIIDRTIKEAEQIGELFNNNDEFSLVGSSSQVRAGISLVTNYSPDLVLVNMQLDEMSGIDFVKLLQNRNIFPEVVFFDETNDLAYNALEVEPFDYLIKPVHKKDIDSMLERLKLKLRKKELFRKMDAFANSAVAPAKRIFAQKGGIVVVYLDEIVFCKAELTKSILVLKCGETIKLKTGISETIETINSDNFIRIGRSHCINKNFLRKIDKRQNRCHLHYDGNIWEVPTSKNTINQLEKLNVATMY